LQFHFVVKATKIKLNLILAKYFKKQKYNCQIFFSKFLFNFVFFDNIK